MYTLLGLVGDDGYEMQWHVLATAETDEALIHFVNDNTNLAYNWIYNENRKLDHNEFTRSSLYQYTDCKLNRGPLRDFIAFEIWDNPDITSIRDAWEVFEQTNNERST